MAAEKIATLNLKRDENVMLFIKNGDVWGTYRKMPGEPRRRPFLVAEVGLAADFDRFIYYVDKDGDVSRIARSVTDPEMRKPAKKASKKKATKKSPPRRRS